MINLVGDVQIGGETQSALSSLAGLTGESADSEGRIEENVTFTFSGEDVELPNEFTFTIWGYYSRCEISQIVTWNDD